MHLSLEFRYNDLVDFGYKKHFRAYHGMNEFARGNSHINGIESFCGYAKNRLMKLKGVDKSMFNLHLKECVFRKKSYLSHPDPCLYIISDKYKGIL